MDIKKNILNWEELNLIQYLQEEVFRFFEKIDLYIMGSYIFSGKMGSPQEKLGMDVILWSLLRGWRRAMGFDKIK